MLTAAGVNDSSTAVKMVMRDVTKDDDFEKEWNDEIREKLIEREWNKRQLLKAATEQEILGAQKKRRKRKKTRGKGPGGRRLGKRS